MLRAQDLKLTFNPGTPIETRAPISDRGGERKLVIAWELASTATSSPPTTATGTCPPRRKGRSSPTVTAARPGEVTAAVAPHAAVEVVSAATKETPTTEAAMPVTT